VSFVGSSVGVSRFPVEYVGAGVVGDSVGDEVHTLV